jgi:hypothetical protein
MSTQMPGTVQGLESPVSRRLKVSRAAWHVSAWLTDSVVAPAIVRMWTFAPMSRDSIPFGALETIAYSGSTRSTFWGPTIRTPIRAPLRLRWKA